MTSNLPIRVVGVREEKLASWKAQMLRFLEGMEEDVDYDSFPDKPDWFDAEKFERGRRFFKENSLPVLLSHFVFLLLGMTIQRFVRVLVLTGKSGTPVDAFKRYQKTGMYIGHWYNGKDFWDEGSGEHKAIVNVRKMHRAASAMVKVAKPLAIGASPPVETSEYNDHATEMLRDVRKDVEGTTLVDEEFSTQILEMDEKTYVKYPMISQFDMGLTELGFTGGMLLCPDYFGVCSSSPEDIAGLDGFVFFWKTVSYCLGVRDEYNVCKEDYSASHDYAMMLSELYVRPLVKRMDVSSVYMADAIALGYQQRLSRFFPSAKVLLYFGSRCPGVDLPLERVYKSFSYMETVQYGFLKFFFGYVLKNRLSRWCFQKSFQLAIFLFAPRKLE